jgi:DNA polymerase theta
MRAYIKPKRGDALAVFDYNQQELRILGHYEGGVLQSAYQENPQLDLHELARQRLAEMLHIFTDPKKDRKSVKNLGFGILYGMGLAKLAAAVGVDEKMAKTVRQAYLNMFPGLGFLDADLKRRSHAKEAFRTWGGREYYVEPPKFIQGRLRTFEYKMLNTLIQGSAADCTKEAMIRYKERANFGHLIISVHDELLMICCKEAAKTEMKILQEAMQSVEFDVPMLADGASGVKSWSALKG